MIIILWILLAIASNTVVGAGVWAAIDEDDKWFFRWFQEVPSGWIQLIMLNIWPVALVIRWREGRE